LQIPTGFRSSAYIANWLQIFKNDNRAIFTAASQASKAAEYLQTREQLQAAE
jgi:antirestriction protein ArdC